VTQQRDQSGFTLTEGMIALGIIAIAILATIGFQVASVKATSGSADLTDAMYLAERYIETLELLHPTSSALNSTSDVTLTPADIGIQAFQSTTGNPFTVIPALSRPVSILGIDMVEVQLTVSWKNRIDQQTSTGRTKSYVAKFYRPL